MAGGLAALGLQQGDTVSVLSPNTPTLFEPHFAVPLSGAVLNTVNSRLEPEPKGVVYHHRGAYLMALGTVAGWSLPQHPTYLSVVPMFHCNGWNHP